MKYTNEEHRVVIAIAIVVAVVGAGAIGFLMGYYYSLNTNCY